MLRVDLGGEAQQRECEIRWDPGRPPSLPMHKTTTASKCWCIGQLNARSSAAPTGQVVGT